MSRTDWCGRKKHPGLCINSWLILEMAKVFNGMHGYISDPTCIGTVFVNAIANILSTSAQDIKLKLKFKNSTEGLIKKLHFG